MITQTKSNQTMTEPKTNHASYANNNGIGNFGGDSTKPTGKKDIIIQSLWTKPITDKVRMRDTLFMAALSLAYAHKSGYIVHMHTDSYGMKLLDGYGYDKLLPTLDSIPSIVPTELFAAGKFFAMRAEGAIGKVHVDIDVFLKKPGVLDKFYRDSRVDVICQMDEDMSLVNHSHIIKHMYALGYPASTRPNWNGSMNTGIIGFNNPILAAKYMSNYFDALKIYTQEKFEQYKKENKDACLSFDFILEQINLSYMSIGYNVHTLLPTKEPTYIADKIGYQHLQGNGKWDSSTKATVKRFLLNIDEKLYYRARLAGLKVK